MSRIVGLLNQIKMIFPQEILFFIYNTLIQPHLNYCTLSWGKYCEPITLLQKRPMRTVYYTKYNVYIETYFKVFNFTYQNVFLHVVGVYNYSIYLLDKKKIFI